MPIPGEVVSTARGALGLLRLSSGSLSCQSSPQAEHAKYLHLRQGLLVQRLQQDLSRRLRDDQLSQSQEAVAYLI